MIFQISMNVHQIHVRMVECAKIISILMGVNVLQDIMAHSVKRVRKIF